VGAGFEAAHQPEARGMIEKNDQRAMVERWGTRCEKPAFHAGFERGCKLSDGRRKKKDAA